MVTEANIPEVVTGARMKLPWWQKYTLGIAESSYLSVFPATRYASNPATSSKNPAEMLDFFVRKFLLLSAFQIADLL